MSVSAPRPHVIFLPDAGPGVGLGHVSRCVALGRAAAALGARVSFVVGEDARAASLLRDAGAEIIPLGGRVNATAALERVREVEADVVVVDSYGASPEFLASLRSAAAQVVAVDDLADRPLPVDVVVNGGIAAEALPYRRIPETLFLLGARYALLDPRYAEAPERRAGGRVSRVLVSLGGGRHEVDLRTALEAVDDVLDGVRVDVVVGRGVAAPRLRTTTGALRNHVVIHEDVSGLYELILAADLAVSGAGMTLYELAATATPSVMVRMADNQRPNFEAFGRRGAALPAGVAGEPRLRGSISSALERLGADGTLRAVMGARGRELVDGRGAARVARAITRPVVSRR